MKVCPSHNAVWVSFAKVLVPNLSMTLSIWGPQICSQGMMPPVKKFKVKDCFSNLLELTAHGNTYAQKKF
jgi:hypothetical protein